MRTSESAAGLFAALIMARSTFPAITKDKTARIPIKSGGSFSYSYAGLDDILDAVTLPLAKHGLAVVQDCAGEAKPGLFTIIIHTTGEWAEFGPMYLPAAADAQSWGSAITYLRRYQLCAALGITADEDNDAATPRAAHSSTGERPAGATQSTAPVTRPEGVGGTAAAALSGAPRPAGADEGPPAGEGSPGEAVGSAEGMAASPYDPNHAHVFVDSARLKSLQVCSVSPCGATRKRVAA